MSGKNRDEILSVILAFLRDIGLEVVATELGDDTFLPGIAIDQGKILFDETRLIYPGDLLHEAGHIAVVPPEKRSALCGELTSDGGVEMAAIAWSYAALLHLNLDPAVVFHDGLGSYRGEAEAIIENFSQGRYFGVPILVWRGMTIDPHAAEPDGPAPYPVMSDWMCMRPDPTAPAPAEAEPVRQDNDCRHLETAAPPPIEEYRVPQEPKAPPELPLTPFTGSRTEAREKFATLCACLLNDGCWPVEHRQAAIDLYELFNEIGGHPQDVIGGEAFTWQQETRLPTGKAITPYSAATCLLDYARTRAFAGGVRAAIEAAKARFPDERIEVLYAGTGPYAPLALMQTPFFEPEELCFTLIDVHPAALKVQAQIVSVLGLADYVAETVQADATQWVPTRRKQYHVAVAEVMQRALITEPQVAVALALSRHLYPHGYLVPERIELSLCLLNPGAELSPAEDELARLSEYFRLSGDTFPDADRSLPVGGPVTDCERIVIGKPFALTAAVAEEHEMTEAGRIHLPPIRLPDRIPTGHELRVLTSITTFGDIALGDYESGLTFPEPLFGNPSVTPGVLYEVWYETLGNPGLRLRPAETE